MSKLCFLYQPLYVVLNVKKSINRGIVVVYVYTFSEVFNTRNITKLLKQYEVWRAKAKHYLQLVKKRYSNKLAIESQ